MESLKNGKYVLESPWKVLEFFVQERVWTLYWTCVPISQHRETGVCWGYASAKAHLKCVKLPRWIFDTKLRGRYESEGSKAFSKAYNNLFNVPLKGAGHLPPNSLASFSSPTLLTVHATSTTVFFSIKDGGSLLMQVFPVVASPVSINQVGRTEKLQTLNHYVYIEPHDFLISYISCNLSITYLLPKGIKIKNGKQNV